MDKLSELLQYVAVRRVCDAGILSILSCCTLENADSTMCYSCRVTSRHHLLYLAISLLLAMLISFDVSCLLMIDPFTASRSRGAWNSPLPLVSKQILSIIDILGYCSRDLLYAVVRGWEGHWLDPDWTTDERFGAGLRCSYRCNAVVCNTFEG